MKTCFKCLCAKPLSEFYKHAQMGDKHLNKCKECTRSDVNKHRQENLERMREGVDADGLMALIDAYAEHSRMQERHNLRAGSGQFEPDVNHARANVVRALAAASGVKACESGEGVAAAAGRLGSGGSQLLHGCADVSKDPISAGNGDSADSTADAALLERTTARASVAGGVDSSRGGEQ